MNEFQPLLNKIADGESLSEAEAGAAFAFLMDGAVPPVPAAGLLMGLRVRGETVAEITGAAQAMRAKMRRVSAPEGAIDIVGTGGDAKGTYNVSTATAFVVAGAGVPVAKHGNRSVSSRSGAADVLEHLGLALDNIADAAEIAEAHLARAGIAFLFAPAFHSAMRHVAPVRKELGVRTIFNLLGPLCNPAGVRHLLVGVFAEHWVLPLAQVLARLGAERAWVVHGADGLDELSTTGPSRVAALEDGQVREFEITPADAGLETARLSDLIGGTPAENAAAIRVLLTGEPSAFRDIVLLNAAAALMIAGKAPDLRAGVSLAKRSIDEGAAGAALAKLTEESAKNRAHG